MFSNLTIDEIRIKCRKQLESFEFWARRFIHEQLLKRHGENYFYYKKPDGNNIIKKSLQESAKKRMDANPGRYTRPVDAILFEDIIDILYNESLYKEFFKKALDPVYPCGREELRVFLSRLIPARNNLSHANPISIRQAEQVICYTNDFIQGLKSFYKKENLFMSYNVPQVVKIIDSLGEECYREGFIKKSNGVIWAFNNRKSFELRPGEIYRVDVEIDPTFDEDEYEIEWQVRYIDVNKFKNKKYIEFEIKEQHVNDLFMFNCNIISKKNWHKHELFDDQLIIGIRVLPPID